MTIETIESTKELPIEFDLRKYDVLGNYEIQDWSREIIRRAKVNIALDGHEVLACPCCDADRIISEPHLPPAKHTDQYSKNLMRQMFVNDAPSIRPISAATVLQMAEQIAPEFKRISKEIEARAPSSTYSDFEWLIFAPGENKLKAEKIDEASIDLFAETEIKKISASECLDGEYSHKSPFFVDLTLPDEQILQDMRELLPRFREILNEPTKVSKFSDSKLAGFRTNRVLQYIDLTLWAKKHGKKITQSAMADALFADLSGDIVDKVRRTVKPLAEELLDPSNVLALHRLAGIRTIEESYPSIDRAFPV